MFRNKTMIESDADDYSWKSYYDCQDRSMSNVYKEHFWISGILLVIFGSVGVLGNIFTIAVLCQPKMRKSTFYNLLVILACFDTLFILTYGIGWAYHSLTCVNYINELVRNKLLIWSRPFLVGSSYMTVAISLERFLGICHPHIQFSRRSLVFILPVLLISSTYAFLMNWNYSSPEDSKRNRIFLHWFPIIFQSIIPLITLILLNGFIIATIKRSRNLMSNNVRQEGNTVKILFSVVLIFLILHLPRVVFGLFMYFPPSTFRNWSILQPVLALTLVINSSVNFVIYSFVGRNFREELIRIFKYRNAVVSNTSSSECGEVLSLEDQSKT